MSNNKKKEEDSQSRNYQITLNNPEKNGFTKGEFKETIMKFNPTYYCISEEIGLKEKTPHFHAYIRSSSPIRFSTIIKRFNHKAHVEKALGSASDNRNYILKTGKWEETDKKETLIDFEEWGEIPINLKEKRLSDKLKLLQDIKDGKSNMEIIESNPDLSFRLREIDTIRANYLSEKYSKEFRNVQTFFIYGSTASYKTSYVYKRFDSKDIFRIYNYNNLNSLWDGYSGQKIILFDEFTGQIPIELMLILTDKFPILNLSARYNNKIAMYEYVFFCSNTDFEKIYSYERVMRTSTWMAWDRRIQNVWEFQKNSDGTPKAIIHKGNETEENIYEIQSK